MPIWSYLFFLRKVLTKQTLSSLGRLVSILLLLILSTSCSQAKSPGSSTLEQLPSLVPNLLSKADFQLSVEPSDNQGNYRVEGTTNLPEQSRIVIAAIRYLRPENKLSLKIASQPTFSILDYKDVKVKEGRWTTDLELWKVAPDGQFKEVWQLNEAKLGLELEPASQVTFLATYVPTTSLWDLEWQLKQEGIKLLNSQISNTADGERYLQTTEVLAVSLPTGQTRPPQPRPQDINGGWGPRYLLLPEPPNINNMERPEQRRIDTPLSPEEFLQ